MCGGGGRRGGGGGGSQEKAAGAPTPASQGSAGGSAGGGGAPAVSSANDKSRNQANRRANGANRNSYKVSLKVDRANVGGDGSSGLNIPTTRG